MVRVGVGQRRHPEARAVRHRDKGVRLRQVRHGRIRRIEILRRVEDRVRSRDPHARRSLIFGVPAEPQTRHRDVRAVRDHEFHVRLRAVRRLDAGADVKMVSVEIRFNAVHDKARRFLDVRHGHAYVDCTAARDRVLRAIRSLQHEIAFRHCQRGIVVHRRHAAEIEVNLIRMRRGVLHVLAGVGRECARARCLKRHGSDAALHEAALRDRRGGNSHV